MASVIVFNDGNNNGDFDSAEFVRAYSSLAEAIAAAGDGQSVYIQDGTWALDSTLVINHSIKIYGQSQAGVVIDARGIPAPGRSGTGIWVTADNVAMLNLTIKGPAAAGGSYGLKVGPDSGVATDTTDNIRLENITVEGSAKSEFDFNGVNGGTFTNLTANGMGTAGVGIAITDSANLTFNGVHTSGNGWGSIAVYEGSTFDLVTADITLNTVTHGANELAIYSDAPNGGALLDAVSYNGATPFVVYTNGYAIGFVTQAEALAYNTGDANRVVENADGSFVVAEGMSIQAAIDRADSGDTIHLLAGAFSVASALSVSKSLTFAGANAGVSAGYTGAGTRGAETVLTGGSGGNMFGLASGITVTFDGLSLVGDTLLDASGAQAVTITNSRLDFDATHGNVLHTGGAGGSFTFTNNTAEISGSTEFLQLLATSPIAITNNVFTGVEDAAAGNDRPIFINLNGSTGTISGNHLSNFDNGISLAATTGPLAITDNLFDDSRRDEPATDGYAAGIVFLDPHYTGVTVSENQFTDVDAGIRTSTYPGARDLSGATIAIDHNDFDGVIAPLFVHDAFTGTLTATASTVDDVAVATLTAGGAELGYTGTTGDDAFVGGAGIEVMVYDEAITADALSYDSATNTWTVHTANNGTDTLVHFDKVTGPDGTSILLVDTAGSYTSLQAAVDAASDGDTVLVAAGTYREQVLIAGKTLSIVGLDGATLEAPATADIGSAGGYRSLLTVKGGAVTIDNLDFDGRSQGDGSDYKTFAAVAFENADGKLLNADITGFQDSTFGGAQHGYGVIARSTDGGTHAVEIASNVIGLFQENGIDARGAGLRVDIHDNTVNGQGSTGVIAQNGIVLVDGAVGTIDGNTVNDLGYTGDNNAAGILLSAAGDGIAVTGNTVDLSGTGSLAIALVDTNAGTISGNALSNADVGIDQNGTFTDAVSSAGANSYTAIGSNFEFDSADDTAVGFTVAGTDGDDLFDGSAGDDSFSAGLGNDTVVLLGSAGAAEVATTKVNGFATAFTGATTAAGGSDTLSGFERLRFDDRTLDLSQKVQLFNATGGLIGTFDTIGAAVTAAGAGPSAVTIVVAAGTYHENVVIDRDNVTLVSASGRAATVIDGVQTGTQQGTIELKTGADNITIGTAGHGFTILGLNGNGASEKAAIYLQQTHDTLSIIDNEIVARGDLGMVSEYNFGITNVTIDGNTFSGKTFEGDYVSKFGIDQFAPGNNVPRQLVALGGGDNKGPANPSHDVSFTNNIVSGVTGAEVAAENGGGTGVYRGNYLVTIDASNSDVSGNSFTGSTLVDYSAALRTRGSGTDVTGNTVTGDSAGIEVSVPANGTAGTYSGNSQTGTAADDVIVSFTPGNDALYGGDGNDVLTGGGGNDLLDGGAGIDTARYLGAASAYTLDVATDATGRVTGFNGIGGAEGSDTFVSIERVMFNGGTVVFDATKAVQLFNSAGQLAGTFDTIQAAINAAGDNATIRVAAGTFSENLLIDKAGLTLEGAPGRATIIRPGTSNATDGNVITVRADGVTIEGLTVTGANATLDATGGVAIGGVVSHAARLISAYSDALGAFAADGLTVSDNALSYGQRYGVVLYAAYSGGNLIENNDFSGMSGLAGTSYRTAVLLDTEAYADVKNNRMVDVGQGIQASTLGRGDPDGTAMEISGNTISAQRGIFVNNVYSSASTIVVENNDVTYGATVAGTEANRVGIRIWSVFNDGAVRVTGNDVAGDFTYGYRLANNPGEVTIAGGTVTGARTAVEVYDNYSFGNQPGENVVTLSGVAISGSTVANLSVADSDSIAVPQTIRFDAGNPPTLGSAPVDVKLAGDTARFDANGYAGDLVITGNAATNELAGGAGDDTLDGGDGIDTAQFQGSAADATILGTRNTQGLFTAFTSVATAAGGTDTLTGIERLQFANGAAVTTLDAAQKVQLFDGAGHIVATFDTIQGAIDAASAGFTIRAAAGTYAENLSINKAVTILGANAGTAGSGARGGETIIAGQALVSAGATIDGVEVLNGTNNTTQFIGVRVTGSADVTVRNTLFYSSGVNGNAEDRAVYLDTTTSGNIVFADNYVTGAATGKYGSSASWHRGLWSDGANAHLTISGNTFEYVRSALNLDGYDDTRVVVANNQFTANGTAVSLGPVTTTTAITGIHDNVFTNVDSDFNLRNLTVGQSFDLDATHNVGGGTGEAAQLYVFGTGGADTLNGTAGDDILDARSAVDGFTDTAANTLNGGAGNDVLIGSLGADTLNGGAGNDTLIGGGGDDTAIVTGAYTVAFAAGGLTVTSADGTDTLSDVEIVTNGTMRTLIVGAGGYDTLADAMADAADGDTILIAAGSYAGNATIDKDVTIRGANAGVAGTATRSPESVLTGVFTITADGVTIDGVKFTGQANTGFGAFEDAIAVAGDNLTVVNSVFAGTPATTGNSAAFETSTVTGLEIANNLFSGYDIGIYVSGGGSAGSIHDNSFQGTGGPSGMGNGVNSETSAVTISGNTFDALYGGSINSSPFGDTDVVMADYIGANTFTNTGARPVQFYPTAGTASVLGTDGNEAFNLDQGGLTAGITASAAGGNDAVYGSNFADVLDGGSGDDVIDGNGGADVIYAGAGNDTIAGGDGEDTLVLSGSWAQYSVSVSGTGDAAIYTITGPDGTDTVTGVETVRIGNTDYALADLKDDAPIANNDDNLPTAGDPTDPGDLLKEDVDSVAVGNLLANDVNTDAQFGDTLRVTSITGWSPAVVPAGGTGAVNSDFGILYVNSDGSYRYEMDGGRTALQTLAEGQVATQVFTYVVADNAGNTSTATLTLTVIGTNDAPVVYTPAQSGTVIEAGNADDGAITAGVPSATGTLIAGDTDAGDTRTWSGDATGTYGNFAIIAGGAWTYTLLNGNAATDALAEGETKTETFTATVTDSQGAARTATVTITITGANDAPKVTAATGTVTEDSGFASGSVASHASDVDAGSSLAFALASGAPTWITMDAAGTYTVDTAAAAFQHLAQNAHQTFDVAYLVTDDKGATTPATLTIDVTGTNDAPVAGAAGKGEVTEAGNADSGAVVGGVPTIDGTLTSTDVDDGATATWSFAGTQGTYGTFAIDAGGHWTYTLDNGRGATQALREGQDATETFTATVSDGLGGSATQTVTITVHGTNDSPVARGETATAIEDAAPITGSVAGNDSDVDGTLRTYALDAPVAGLTLGADGSYTFDPSASAYQALAAGETQVVNAAYTVTDEFGATAGATLAITVTGVNDAPTLTAVTGTPVELSESAGPVYDNFTARTGTLTVNDVDHLDGVSARILSTVVTLNGQPYSGAIATDLTKGENGGSALTFGTVTPNGSAAALGWTYDPGRANLKTLSKTDTVTITYTVAANDGDADSTATQQIVVNVHGINDVYTGDDDDNTLTGTGNADDIFGGNGDDGINAGGGNDEVYGGDGDDSILAGGGNDLVYGGDGDDSLDGASGADILYGGGGDDVMSGGSDNDTFYVGDGNAMVNGGSGSDTLVLDHAWSDYTITKAGSSTYVLEGPEGEINATAVENFVFAGNAPGATGPFTAAQIVNDAPIGVNDAGATGNVLANDTDADKALGDTLVVTGVRAGTEAAGGTFGGVPAGTAGTTIAGKYGSLTIHADGSYSYAVDANDPDTVALGTGTATEVFTYRVSDAKGLTDAAQIAIAVTGTNAAPVANDDSYTIAEDAVRTFSVAELVGNDTDANGDTLSIQSVTGATGGVVTLNANGTVTFTPTADFNGTAGFDYVVGDGHGGSDTGHVTVTVTPVNDAPVAAADAYSVAEDGVLTVALPSAGLLGNDSDVDSASLTAALATAPANGTIVLNADGTFTYTPNANFNGTDSFTYVAGDGATTSAPTTVTITVTAVNDAPVANPDALSATEDTPVTFTAAQLLGNDTDVDSPATALSIASVTSGAGGTAVLNGDGTVTFTPNADFNGAATFTYTVTDGSATSAPATATVTVAAVNDVPVAVADTLNVDEDTPLVIAAASLTANDTDADNDALTVIGVSNASNGTVSLSNGQITFTPAADFHGVATFDYTVVDPSGASATATVTVNVASVNDAPVANPDTLAATEDTVATFSAADLIGNDRDVDGDGLTLVSVTSGTGGTVSLQGGVVTFTPSANFNGPATFTYQVSDGITTSTGTVTVNVAAANDNPTPVADSFTIDEDASFTVAASTLLANDGDVDGDTLTLTGVGNASHGTVSLANGQVTFVADADYNGVAGYDYTVSDGNGGTATAHVTVNVTSVNDAPVAVADTLSATEDTPVTFTAAQLLGNDTDVDTPRAGLAIASVTSGAGGTAVLNANGTVTFTPGANFNGAASFTYTTTDGAATSAPATVTVNVAAVNDVATITGTTTGSVTEDGTLTTGGTVTVTDPDTGEAVFQTPPSLAGAHGTFTFNATTGAWGYALNNADPAVQALNTGQTLSDTLVVRSADGTASATLQVTINGVNEPQPGIFGTAGDDVLNGTTAADDMYGLDGNDVLNGSAGADRLFGGNGIDTANYAASTAAVTVNLATGTGLGGDAAGDTYSGVENVTGSAQADTLTGDGNANTLNGGVGNDTLSGGGGNDVLIGGTGNDAMAGGLGDDTYEVDSTGDTVTEAANEGTDTVRTTLATFTLGNNLENLTYLGAAAFTGNGNALANVITGGAGADRIDGKAGADTMIGLGGNDSYTVDDAGDIVVEAVDGGNDTVTASVSYLLTANVENLTLVGGDLNGTGNVLDNVLKGTSGNNRLDGGQGADNMQGGLGDDTYVVDNVGDAVNEAANGGTDTIETTLLTLALRTNVENLTFVGTGDFTGRGNALDNVITGGAGNDSINGDAGADTMIGLGGNDSYIVDNLGDVVVEAAGGGNDTVQVLVSGWVATGEIETITLASGYANVTGSATNNRVVGNSGANRLDGGAGADTLTGGNSNDTFVFHRGEANGDVVTDFAGAGIAGGDVIELQGYGTIASGASIVRIGMSDSYLITADAAHGGGTETITLTGVLNLGAGDIVFL